MRVITAKDHILGRLSSHVAKALLNGEKIVIVEAEKALITGKPLSVMADYRRMRELRHRRKGPFFPRLPDRILRRTVRGMLPMKRPRGRAAYKRLMVYMGIPREFREMKIEDIADAKELRCEKYTTLGEVSRYLGGIS